MPKEVLQMRAEDFLNSVSESEEFERKYNLTYRVIDISSINLLTPLANLLNQPIFQQIE